MNYTFVGDIHSASDDLSALLSDPFIEGTRLVFLGDYIDGIATRHESAHDKPQLINPLRVLEIVMDRVNNHGDTAILGNHDDFWIETARGNDLAYQTWRINGGAHTWRKLGIHSSNSIVVADSLNHEPLKKYTRFLETLPLIWKNEHILAVHAGVNWEYSFKEQTKDDLMWIRDKYYFDNSSNWHHNDLGKVIVTGHTPVQTIANDGRGYFKMQSDEDDIPRYLIDAGSRSGASNGGIFALTLDEQGNEVSKRWVINGNVFDGDKTHQMK
ncbi:metallophosphoesterase family protein [Paucilactobacillus wasatchensis]|uniref:Diadenosine tetraphosphatase related serine/threonine protein phosphatase n=1 Tax=Paucilactobacillus wasatchensis TaxID=1335616 RepID=A0A0D1A4G2_9LACO|nr:metallophosphoesterase [Paucilactobacillus wasatchensis]KIS02790.1 Diadenosine tetraphosphatase related serine/threonine protein phosphatase [Paucilactobacillus wasatchensis]